MWLSANRSQNSPHQAETQAIVSFQRTKGNNLVRFLLLSTHTRSVCPRCVSLDSAHLAYEPLQTGFLCFYCRPTTLLIRMWTLLLSWCSQEKKKKKEEELKTQSELGAGQTTIRIDKNGKILPRKILQKHLHQVENIRIGFSLWKGVFGSICLIVLQKCKLRMALKLCKKQLDAAGPEYWLLRSL